MKRTIMIGIAGVLGLGVVSSCATVPPVQMVTVRDFVRANLQRNEKLTAILMAADAAEKAYNMVADMPADQLEANPKDVSDLVNRAHDAWRKARSFRTPVSATLRASNVVFSDYPGPEASIPVEGAGGIHYRVHVSEQPAMGPQGFPTVEVHIEGIDTSRGVNMLSFDDDMNPLSVERDFLDYLAGDHVRVGGRLGIDISRHGDVSERGPGASPAPAAQPPPTQSAAPSVLIQVPAHSP